VPVTRQQARQVLPATGHQSGNAYDHDGAPVCASRSNPTTRLAVDTITSFEPSTAARSQPSADRSAARRGWIGS
jgi:hypothetical protein